MASALTGLKSEILRDGEDLAICSADMTRIRAALADEHAATAEELRVLIEMRTQARRVCPEFDEFFLPALHETLLADGRIDAAEQFALLRLLYGGGGIDPAERRFLHRLRGELPRVTPEFEALYQQVMRDSAHG